MCGETMDAGASPSEAELVERARTGDVAAFGRLVERTQDRLYNAVCRLVGNEQDAEDIAQEVFVKAFKNIAQFRGRSLFTTWLYGIMLNSVRSFWRAGGRRPALSLNAAGDDDGRALPDPPASGDGPARSSERREQVEAVQAALAALDAQAREIVVLRDIQGLTYDELAEILALPPGTVKSRLHRARMALKDELQCLWEPLQ